MNTEDHAAATSSIDTSESLEDDSSDEDPHNADRQHFLPGNRSRRSTRLHEKSKTGLLERLSSWLRDPTDLLRSRTRDVSYKSLLPVAESGSVHQSSRADVGFSLLSTIREIAFSSWINILLVFVPVGIATHFAKTNVVVIFVANALAIIPLASLLAFATECIAIDLGDTVGALMSISFGNSVEIIMLITLVHDHIHVVQDALVGSILVNLLLILGSAILAGVFQPNEQTFDLDNAQALACLLCLSVFTILLPTALHYSFKNESKAQHAVLTLSRASAVTLLLIYIVYISFLLKSRRSPAGQDSRKIPALPQLGSTLSLENNFSRSHSRSRSIMFTDENPRRPRTQQPETFNMVELDGIDHLPSLSLTNSAVGSDGYATPEQSGIPPNYTQKPSTNPSHLRSRSGSGSRLSTGRNGAGAHSTDSRRPTITRLLSRSPTRGVDIAQTNSVNGPPISKAAALVLLASTSVLVAFCADFLVGTINDMVTHTRISESFIGLIILPIAGNAAEYVTAVTVAAKNKVDLAIGVSMGSSIQVALFVNPFVVIMGWILRKEMTLYFGLFETVTLLGAALLVNFLILNGKTNYLEGTLLCACYVILGVGAYLMPPSE